MSDPLNSDVTLTAHLPERANEHHNEPATVTYYRNQFGNWRVGSYEVPDKEPSSFVAECSCGATFTNWGVATAHVEEEHE